MKTIVICGSMKFKDKILEISDKLENLGFKTELPKECMEGLPKEIASRAHFNRIQNKDTDAILVVNCDKGELKNYIGPNSFAEIAFAFYFKKKIFLLQDIYEPYLDELKGWNTIPLNNTLESIKRFL
ncbi:MAG: hypothetical protein HFI49_03510 [Bacilli bacterium]|jgi:hypothetical protein|nr:hypothetical protein [Bacilli bacterium]